MTTTTHTQVLVVGAGPTGLVLAAQLLARGIDTRIIDKGPGPLPQSRALGIQARTLEMLDTLGVADEFISAGQRVRNFRMYTGNRPLLDVDLSRNGSRHGFILHLPQQRTECLLRARLVDLGGAVESGHRLVSLTQEPNRVRALVSDASGRTHAIEAAYAVGCDGAHSRVRKEIGVAFEGKPYPEDWLLADVAADGVGRDDAIHGFFRPNGLPVICLPIGGGRWRLVMPYAGERDRRTPTLEELREIVDERAPHPIAISDPEWLSCFRSHLRMAATYRRGRVFLAGDAAHIHSPAGGQGMNTGMQDAHNLGWKLALVARGTVADGLLDTYTQERLPVASGVLGFTDRIVRLSTLQRRAPRMARDLLLPTLTRIPAVQRRAASRLSQVSVSCAGSPLVVPTGWGDRSAPRPGHRMPDLELTTADGTIRLNVLLRRGRHVLLSSGGLAPAGVDATLVEAATAELPGRAFTLVRPDGVVALRGPGEAVVRYLEGLRTMGCEELVEERGRLVGQHPADHVGAVVQAAVADHVPQ